MNMMETLLSAITIATSLAISSGVWYRMGKLESTIDFIYKNVDIVMTWNNKFNNKR
jgi:hypothetical protein